MRVGGAAADVHHQHALGYILGQTVERDGLVVDFGNGDVQVSGNGHIVVVRPADDLAVLNEHIDDFNGVRHRDGESDALVFIHQLERVDAHDLSLHIQQRTAAVAGVDGGVGLKQAHRFRARAGAGGNGHFTFDAGDNALRERAGKADAVRRADGHDRVADRERVRIAQFDGRDVFRVDFQNRQIGGVVAADKLGVVFGAVVEDDVDGGVILNHMVVGDDVAVRGDDKSAADRIAVSEGGADGRAGDGAFLIQRFHVVGLSRRFGDADGLLDFAAVCARACRPLRAARRKQSAAVVVGKEQRAG